ncbi:MAG: hemin uptake protein HemP [Polaromonas sp.]|uniref:hemin uptake protein HemP n=1 Tax=Polaromonas sp. TaxID=1869339 RepID=UPI002731BAB3|nr:hemin uptake protein HemP [Polaromonas sp.]MDP2254609.1 hemin uptake protein HemP [Polaromonas sp.]MDP3707108.1 hemin uptake protein HemP [Polaromonas sp.]
MSLVLPSSQALSLPSCSAPNSEANPDTKASGTSANCMSSTDILRGQKAVEIRHNGFIYRLQATRLGKLILTK